jgi:uncharacterized damage-inducible protein DinB
MRDYFIEQADYQRWASAELFKSLDSLSDEQRQADISLFFRNIHKTVDHILVVTRNWRARLAGEFGQVKNHDASLYDEWEQLKPALLDEFAQLKTWLTQKKPEWFQQAIEYPGSDGTKRRVSVRNGLIHIMTHAVHHRGQITAACTRLHVPSPEMDFLYYLRRKQS